MFVRHIYPSVSLHGLPEQPIHYSMNGKVPSNQSRQFCLALGIANIVRCVVLLL